MEIIPVIDLLEGLAVHARLGQRHLYRPIEQFGGGRGNPRDVISAYRELADFHTFYLADLDALSGRTPQWKLVESLVSCFSGTTFWMDAACHAPPPEFSGRITPVIGSESLPGGMPQVCPADFILSLDFRGGEFLGHPALLEQPEEWPDRLILMNLARVGSNLGPDLDQIGALLDAHPKRRIYAAGGVRGASDLLDLARSGVHGVLMATALQRGLIPRGLLSRTGNFS